MPGISKRLVICASPDGLLIQPINAKDHAPDSDTLLVQYGSINIKISTDKIEDESKGSLIEAHGIVGLLDLGSTTYLIAISAREQVAQIRSKPVYTITDVALIPLNSQSEARHAIEANTKAARQERASGYESDESDYVDDDDTSSIGDVETPGVDAASSEPYKEGLMSKGTSVIKDVVQDRGKYGRFAERWFSKGSAKREETPRPAVGGVESGLTPEQKKQAVDSLPNDSEQKDAQDSLADLKSVDTAHNDEEGAGLDDSKHQTHPRNTIETLSRRILRTTKLYFTSKSFFFSYEYDISTRLAEQASASSTAPLHKRFEENYFWNRHLVQPFISAGQERLVLPLLQGFVGQRAFSLEKSRSGQKSMISEAADSTAESIEAQNNPASQSGEQDFLLTLISRRSVKRAGLRYLRRGLDDEGNVANNVETEQILSPQDWDTNQKIFSLIQIRGSIPLFFTQSPYSFKPQPQTFGSESTNHNAFKKHFDMIARRYGRIQVANLVDKHGTERGIGEAYEGSAKWLNGLGGVDGNTIGFEWFDFHHECKGMRFENVSILINTLQDSLKSFGWAVKENDRLQQQQQGVLRTNCMDCLDRTNVTQSSVGGWVLQQQLAELGLIIDLQTDPKSIWFNQLWADNGDAISKQYAGTAALKGDFTRTRKRNWAGALSDFSLTLNRYYNNIFGDYFLQICIDYFLGYVGPGVFDDFETDMVSQDYALDVRRIRQNAIDVCAKIVLEDPQEDLLAGWTLSCPQKANTLRSQPFEECVLLLTNAALYFCRFDWNSEKVGSFERIELGNITELWRGPYITSVLGPAHMDESRNVGFAFRYNTHGEAIVRRNTRTVDNEEPAEDQNEGQSELQKQAEPLKDQRRLLAFKILPPQSSVPKAQDVQNEVDNVTDAAKRISEEIHQASIGASQRRVGSASVPDVQENPIVSLAEARKSTGYIESIGYTLKKLVW